MHRVTGKQGRTMGLACQGGEAAQRRGRSAISATNEHALEGRQNRALRSKKVGSSSPRLRGPARCDGREDTTVTVRTEARSTERRRNSKKAGIQG